MNSQVLFDLSSYAPSFPTYIGQTLVINGVTIFNGGGVVNDLPELEQSIVDLLNTIVSSPDYIGQVVGSSVKVISQTPGTTPNGYVAILTLTEIGGATTTCVTLDFSSFPTKKLYAVTVKADGTTIATASGFYTNINVLINQIVAAIGAPYSATNPGGSLQVCADDLALNGTEIEVTVESEGFAIESEIDTSAGAYTATSPGVCVRPWGRTFWSSGQPNVAYVDNGGMATSFFQVHSEVADYQSIALQYSEFTDVLYIYECHGAGGNYDRLYAVDRDGVELRLVADFGITAGCQTLNMAINYEGKLFIPFRNLNTVRVFNCSGVAIPEPEQAYSAVSLTDGTSPLWVACNPQVDDPNYGNCYVACGNNKLVIINKDDGTQVTIDLTFQPARMIFVENTGDLGVGTYKLWIVGSIGSVEVFNLDGTLYQSITLPGSSAKADICLYESAGVVFVTDFDYTIQLQTIKTSDFTVTIPGFALTGSGYSIFDMVYNPDEDRLFGPYLYGTGSPIYRIVYALTEDTITGELTTGVEPIITEFIEIFADGTEPLSPCVGCKALTADPCNSQTTINAGLEPETYYFYTIVDKFGNKYTDGGFSDTNGNMTVKFDVLPIGSTSRWSGPYTIQFKVDQNAEFSENVNITGTITDCITLTFQ